MSSLGGGGTKCRRRTMNKEVHTRRLRRHPRQRGTNLQYDYLFECRDSVTSNFPDGKFSRPRLAAFSLYFLQTHASLRLSRPDERQEVGFLILSLRCSNAGTRTPIAGARNQCPTVRRHSIYIVYYTLYIASIQGVRGVQLRWTGWKKDYSLLNLLERE